ncbi:MAG: hypothetical protein JMDDDDMK_03567 [Acidobacteria bacterium]|nr:hypothetical protein [Acidobacteriota bacterium]
MLFEDRAHLVGELAGVRVRDRVGHRGAHVHIALLELRHELAAEPGEHRAARDERNHRQAERDKGTGQRGAERPVVACANPSDQESLALAAPRLERERRHGGRKGQRQNQRAAERQAVSHRHRAEDLAFDTRHREQRKESRDDDRR